MSYKFSFFLFLIPFYISQISDVFINKVLYGFNKKWFIKWKTQIVLKTSELLDEIQI
jgi:hypothetical protein